MRFPRKKILILVGLLLCLPLLQACRIPTSMAPYIAKEAIDGWLKVKTTTQTSKIWPDRSRHPDDVYTIRYQDRNLFSARQGFRYDLLEPAEQAGFSQGAVVGAFWLRLRENQGLLRIEGLPDFDPERSTELVTRIARENLKIMEFDLTRIKEGNQTLVRITATPTPWSGKYFFQSITVSDPSTRVIRHAEELDRKGRVGQVWDVVAYEKDLPQEDGIYQVPNPAVKEPLLLVNVSKGSAWSGGAIEGRNPLLLPGGKGVHRLSESPFGPVLVSDYSDGLNMMTVVHYPKNAPLFVVPWSREVAVGERRIKICLVSGSVFASFQTKDFNGFILAQENIFHVLSFFESLEGS